MDLLRSVARPLLAAPFILDGIDAMVRPAGHVEKIQRITPALERLGCPPLLDSDATLMTRASGAGAVLAGVCLATGHLPRTSAAALAAMSVPLAIVNNPVWLEKGKAAKAASAKGLLRSLTIGAGLTIAAVDRGGKPSLGWKREQARLAKEAAKTAARTAASQA